METDGLTIFHVKSHLQVLKLSKKYLDVACNLVIFLVKFSLHKSDSFSCPLSYLPYRNTELQNTCQTQQKVIRCYNYCIILKWFILFDSSALS